jgi:hypothetical protein
VPLADGRLTLAEARAQLLAQRPGDEPWQLSVDSALVQAIIEWLESGRPAADLDRLPFFTDN